MEYLVGEALLSGLFKSIGNELASPLIREFRGIWGIDKDLKRLEMMLGNIQAVIKDAEQKQISDLSVKEWLKDLTDVAYDIDDILDRWAYEAERSKMEDGTETCMNQVTTCINQVCKLFLKCINDFSDKPETVYNIKAVIGKLEEIEKAQVPLRLSEIVGRRSVEKTWRLPTTSVFDESEFVGRENDTNEIIELLLKPSRKNVSVVSIVGMGGLGKTTLAQHVFHDTRVGKEHFQIKAWVCVSDEFDVMRLTQAILESVTKKTQNFTQLNSFHDTIQDELRGKRFLLILDDVWNEIPEKWERLSAPLGVGAPGSKILITTRSQNVTLITGGADSVHHLRVLSDKNCNSLFMQYAFREGNSSDYPHLKVIGEKIVKKCKGLPLAAKTLGGLLYSKVDEDEWKHVLQSEMWNLPDDRNILPALRLSYHHLPSHLKQCFAYCSIFPKDYDINKEKLVWLWMAQGYVQSKGPTKSLEDVGNDYFDELFSRCFFQQNPKYEEGYFVMHDLVHDLAQSISGELICRMGFNSSSNISQRTRHSSFLLSRNQSEEITNLEALYQAESLRTFLVYYSCWKPRHFSFFRKPENYSWQPRHDFWQKLRYLRVLDLSRTATDEIPDSVSNLRQLRYIDFSSTKIKMLPESIGRLFNLQKLNLQFCHMFEGLPKSIGNLKQLRHLDLTKTAIPMLPESLGSLSNLLRLQVSFCKRLDKLPDSIGNLKHIQYIDVSDTPVQMLPGSIGGLSNLQELKLDGCEMLELSKTKTKTEYHHDQRKLYSIPIGIGKLTSLRRLPLFVAREESWAKLGELKELKKLEGQLHISGLETVIDADEAKDAASKDKQYLRELKLEWGDVNDNVGQQSVVELVLDNLQPHTNLEVLNLKGFSGSRISNWMGDPSSKLTSVSLEDLPNLEELFGVEDKYEFFCLRQLMVTFCEKLRKLPDAFPALRNLAIRSCNGLTILPSFPALTYLIIDSCDGLTVLPPSFPVLTYLRIGSCNGLTVLPSFPALTNLDIVSCDGQTVLPSFPALIDLNIYSCDGLTVLPKFSALRNLNIDSCYGLTVLPSFPALKYLTIKSCDGLTVLPGLPTLCSLNLDYSSYRESLSLSLSLQAFTSLERLRISCSPNLLSFSEGWLPTTLKRLSFSSCPIKDLPKGLKNLTSLESLRFSKCHELESLPENGLPNSLKSFELENCKFLSTRCTKGGEDWLKIAHILEKSIW